jgi:hypothetical protein
MAGTIGNVVVLLLVSHVGRNVASPAI